MRKFLQVYCVPNSTKIDALGGKGMPGGAGNSLVTLYPHSVRKKRTGCGASYQAARPTSRAPQQGSTSDTHEGPSVQTQMPIKGISLSNPQSPFPISGASRPISQRMFSGPGVMKIQPRGAAGKAMHFIYKTLKIQSTQ